ncbi:MAG: molecular chaperone TorD family protein [candidate division NC10 bacterium]|nr:molecular chaperone TorD family protein [candidate division NC10 bacterium]MBI2457989.1 molecular chaperone TorD family protein [candidate division NC10 bacterium]MBI3084568.1 molecular chaperone TorD family protein [candidate division NC10 bacterium]
MTDRVSWATARANMYRFLSAAFLEVPSAAMVAPLLADGFVDGLEEMFGAGVADDLRQFVRGFQGDYAALDQEFQDLFMVPLGRYVTPYEAVYRDEREIGETRVQGLLMGASTLAVKQLYREAGAAVSEDFKDLPDHVGLELACMEFLCGAEARAWDREEIGEIHRVCGFQKRLLQEHLIQWVPALCERVRERAAGPFYRGIASLMEAFLVQEAEALTSSGEI